MWHIRQKGYNLSSGRNTNHSNNHLFLYWTDAGTRNCGKEDIYFERGLWFKQMWCLCITSSSHGISKESPGACWETAAEMNGFPVSSAWNKRQERDKFGRENVNLCCVLDWECAADEKVTCLGSGWWWCTSEGIGGIPGLEGTFIVRCVSCNTHTRRGSRSILVVFYTRTLVRKTPQSCCCWFAFWQQCYDTICIPMEQTMCICSAYTRPVWGWLYFLLLLLHPLV